MEEGGQSNGVVIDIDDVGDLVNSIMQRLDVLPARPLDEFTIFRVPAHVREANKTLYEPRMVSIGPYHRRDGLHLRPMEEHKWIYLRDLLSRRPDKITSLQGCVGAIKAMEARARGCYAESIDLTKHEFVEMLLLDGCFIVEFLIKWHFGELDTMVDVGWSLPLIRSDLLLMENQIPFFVLQSLYDLLVAGFIITSEVDPPRDMPTLTEFMIEYLMRAKIEHPSTLTSTDGVRHLLHLYHSCYMSTMNLGILSYDGNGGGSSNPLLRLVSSLSSYLRVTKGRRRSLLEQSNIRSPRTIPCATELKDVGIRFKKKAGSLLDVTFRDGTMEIPYLSIEDSTRSRLMNLVAFEQCNGRGEKKNLTSYATFMDCIINTAGDVAILEECGIIENKLPSKEDAALFFNQLCDCGYIDYEDHYLVGLFREVKQYCESDWHKYRAKLMHDYFSNPWAILSLVAALVLLVLTLVQTFFAILSYSHPP